MSQRFEPFYVFEHTGFADVYDAQRQSRLYGFRYLGEHTKYVSLFQRLKQEIPAAALEGNLERPLEAVPVNSALYIVSMSSEGRNTVLPVLLREAVALGFSVLDDYQGQCHCPAGVWTVDGLQPHDRKEA